MIFPTFGICFLIPFCRVKPNRLSPEPYRLRPEPYRLRPESEIPMIITFRQNISSSLTVGRLSLSGRVLGQGWEQKALQTHRWLFHMFVGFPFKNTLWPNGTWKRTCFWLLEKSFNLFTFWMTAQSGQFCFKKGFWVCQKYIPDSQKRKTTKIHWIPPQLNPFLNNPWSHRRLTRD